VIQKILTIAVLGILLFAACEDQGRNKKTESNQAEKDSLSTREIKLPGVPYSVAKNYFVKNTVKEGGLENAKIETKENFDKIFGTATRMGQEGKPTEIDFSKQYVIAVVRDETDSMAEIIPVSLQKGDKNQIFLIYRISKGAKRSFKIRPAIILVVDKTNDGTVIVKERLN